MVTIGELNTKYQAFTELRREEERSEIESSVQARGGLGFRGFLTSFFSAAAGDPEVSISEY